MKRKFILLGVTFILMLMMLQTAAFADFINTTGPTGTYYQYGVFTQSEGSPFLGGNDVDSYGDKLYVNRDGDNLDVYQITLLDSDGDGLFEPEQHPDNPKATGSIEQRTLTFVQTYQVPQLASASQGEIYAASDRVYFISQNGSISQYVFASGDTSAVLSLGNFDPQLLGYDDVNNEWYAATTDREVYKWNGSSWVFQFSYADLAGSHMDGLEVVTDPATSIPYVYVSDMTSNYIGQWKYDTATSAWVEKNLFQYNDLTGSDVEGMGFGALGHFWITSWDSVYEVGGGDLTSYVANVSSLTLSPNEATSDVGKTHNVTVNALLNGKPVAGAAVTFTVTGANPTSGSVTTNSSGQATFSYVGSVAGNDTIVATTTIDGKTVISNKVTKTWVAVARIAAKDTAKLSLRIFERSKKNIAIMLGGTLKKNSGKGIARKVIIIKANGRKIGWARTNARGVFHFKHRPKKNTTYIAVYAGDTSYTKSSSNKVVIKRDKSKDPLLSFLELKFF